MSVSCARSVWILCGLPLKIVSRGLKKARDELPPGAVAAERHLGELKIVHQEIVPAWAKGALLTFSP